MFLESTFNRLCNTRYGGFMILVVGIGLLGFIVLVVESAKRFL